MADLTEIQSSQAVKIAGAGPSTGIEDNYLDIDTSGRITIVPLTIASTVSTSPTDGQKQTYSASVSGLVVAALATDILTIQGSGTKTIRITSIEISGTTTAGSGIGVSCTLVKRSSANTGGITSTLTNVPYDSTNAAGTATIKTYTVNPTGLGTSVGIVRADRINIPTTGASGVSSHIILWEFGLRPAQAVVLRGTSEYLCINLGSTTITGPLVSISIEWTEE